MGLLVARYYSESVTLTFDDRPPIEISCLIPGRTATGPDADVVLDIKADQSVTIYRTEDPRTADDRQTSAK